MHTYTHVCVQVIGGREILRADFRGKFNTKTKGKKRIRGNYHSSSLFPNKKKLLAMESKIKYDSEEEEFTCKLVQDLLSSVIMKGDG